jgi:nitrate reductase NapE component
VVVHVKGHRAFLSCAPYWSIRIRDNKIIRSKLFRKTPLLSSRSFIERGVIRGKALPGFPFCLRRACLPSLHSLGQKPVEQTFRTTVHQTQAASGADQQQRREKMHQPLRHIEDTVTSIVALLAVGMMGFFGLVVLMLTLALGF